MVNKNSRAYLIAAVVGATMILGSGAMAQSQQREPGKADLSAFNNRPNTIKRMGLGDERIGLTSEQKTEVDKIVDAYLVEQNALRMKYPAIPGKSPSPEGIKAREAARIKMSASLGKVLSAEQRKTWETTRQADLAARGLQSNRQPER